MSSSKEAGGNKKINNRGRLQDSVNGVRKGSDRLMGLSEKAKKKEKKATGDSVLGASTGCHVVN